MYNGTIELDVPEPINGAGLLIVGNSGQWCYKD